MLRTGTWSIVARTGSSSSGLLRCIFSSPGMQTRYHSHRARTAASRASTEEVALLCLGELGGDGPAAVSGLPFPGRSGRFPLVRRHRGKLAAARHLRDHQLRRDHAHAVPAAWLSGISGGDFRHFRSRKFPRRFAGAGAVRLGHVLSDRRYGASAFLRASRKGSVPLRRAMSLFGQLRRGRIDRDARDLLHGLGVLPRHSRTWHRRPCGKAVPRLGWDVDYRLGRASCCGRTVEFCWPRLADTCYGCSFEICGQGWPFLVENQA